MQQKIAFNIDSNKKLRIIIDNKQHYVAKKKGVET